MIGNIAVGLYGIPVPPVTNSFDSIATVTVGAGGQSSISFTSIPSTYKHLQIRGFAKNAQTTYAGDNMQIRFNGDSATNYSFHYIEGYSTNLVRALGSGTQTVALGLHNALTGSQAGYSNVFSAFVIDILDYASTSKNKTVKTLGGFDSNGDGNIQLASGAWYNSTTAINQIVITDETSSNFVQYSSFALYGIKDS